MKTNYDEKQNGEKFIKNDDKRQMKHSTPK